MSIIQITATGSTQADAFAIVPFSVSCIDVAVVPPGSGILLPKCQIPSHILIFNNGVNTLNIYPNLGGTINAGSKNAPITLAAGSSIILYSILSTSNPNDWYSFAGSGGGGGVPATGATITQALLAIPTPAYASTINFDLSTASIFEPAPLTGNVILTLSNAPASSPWVRPFTIILTQDATGSRLVTSWFSGFTISWTGGSPPLLSTAPNAIDTFTFIQTGPTTLLGFVSGQTGVSPTTGSPLTPTSVKTSTYNCSGSDVFNKAGGSTTGSLSVASQGIIWQYSASPKIWYVIGDDLPLSQLDLRYTNLGHVAAFSSRNIIM